jgi:uncharacterized protein involved in type VI secretion and phage assembly
MSDEELSREARYGVYRAVVTDNRDPGEQGRVKVRLADRQEAWAELATLLAGDGYGTWFRPDPGDEVLVAFEAGDPRRPYVVGLSGGKTIARQRPARRQPLSRRSARAAARKSLSTTRGARCVSRRLARYGS